MMAYFSSLMSACPSDMTYEMSVCVRKNHKMLLFSHLCRETTYPLRSPTHLPRFHRLHPPWPLLFLLSLLPVLLHLLPFLTSFPPLLLFILTPSNPLFPLHFLPPLLPFFIISSPSPDFVQHDLQ